jgi:hypothetical protein
MPLCSSVPQRDARECRVPGVNRVEGADGLPECGVCRRSKVRVRRGEGGVPVLLCLACDGGPLVDKARAALTDEQRRALNL